MYIYAYIHEHSITTLSKTCICTCLLHHLVQILRPAPRCSVLFFKMRLDTGLTWGYIHGTNLYENGGRFEIQSSRATSARFVANYHDWKWSQIFSMTAWHTSKSWNFNGWSTEEAISPWVVRWHKWRTAKIGRFHCELTHDSQGTLCGACACFLFLARYFFYDHHNHDHHHHHRNLCIKGSLDHDPEIVRGICVAWRPFPFHAQLFTTRQGLSSILQGLKKLSLVDAAWLEKVGVQAIWSI